VIDADGLLAARDIEALVIAASSDAYYELIVAVANAGKAVFCEKPMSIRVPARSERAIAAAGDASCAAGTSGKCSTTRSSSRSAVRHPLRVRVVKSATDSSGRMPVS